VIALGPSVGPSASVLGEQLCRDSPYSESDLPYFSEQYCNSFITSSTMSSTLPPLADAQNKFEDLSGVNIADYENPYDALIEACGNNPVRHTPTVGG
jgi:hypothetical protein